MWAIGEITKQLAQACVWTNGKFWELPSETDHGIEWDTSSMLRVAFDLAVVMNSPQGLRAISFRVGRSARWRLPLGTGMGRVL